MKRWRDIATVAATKVATGAVVLAGGFRAVSDDDFARIVHAQQWASSPKLDPTGTSWLPLPFWLYGGVMKIFGTDPMVSRATAFVLGVASAVVIYLAARVLFYDRRDALLGALLAAILPWSARLGVATVPELPTAALSLYGIATLQSRRRNVRAWGGAALLAACLSRYEPWPLALVFVAFTLADARRDVHKLWAAALAALGPLLWLAHNVVAHGEALHFAARVSAYQRALGGAVASYPMALVREEPELFIFTALLAIGTKLPRSLRRPAVALAAMMLSLVVASMLGGAPTHHAGRALLVIWLAMVVYVAHGVRGVMYRKSWRKWLALSVCIVMPLGALVLRPWYARLDAFIDRNDELAIGRAAAAEPGLILCQVDDYAHFAIQAGTGNPARIILDRSIDPRTAPEPSSFTSADRAQTRAKEAGAAWIIAKGSPALSPLGHPQASAGSWRLWRVK